MVARSELSKFIIRQIISSCLGGFLAIIFNHIYIYMLPTCIHLLGHIS